MIKKLIGTITATQEGLVIIELSGFGLSVHCLHKYCPGIGSKETLYTHLVVRENLLDLYGFTDKNELLVFELLLNIPKIGPKSALQILNQADTNLITEAVINNDYEYLHRVSGLGKKTAEKIVQSLQTKKDKLPHQKEICDSNFSAIQHDAIETLVTLGYESNEVRKVVNTVTDNTKNPNLNDIVATALQQLNTKK